MLETTFLIGPRVAGAVADAYPMNPEVAVCPFEDLQIATLIIHAMDDPLASYDAAATTEARIPGAPLVSLDSGGHLQLGQDERVRTEIAAFLAA